MICTSSVSSSPRACGRDTRTKGGEMVQVSRGPLCPKMWTAVDHSWEQFNTIHLLYVYSTVYMWFEASSCITLSNITRRWDNQGTTALWAGDIAGTYHAENKRWTTSGPSKREVPVIPVQQMPEVQQLSWHSLAACVSSPQGPLDRSLANSTRNWCHDATQCLLSQDRASQKCDNGRYTPAQNLEDCEKLSSLMDAWRPGCRFLHCVAKGIPKAYLWTFHDMAMYGKRMRIHYHTWFV